MSMTILLVATGCTREQWHRFPSPDDVIARFGWFSTMKKRIAIQPYQIPPREPVPGTVPIGGIEPDLPLTIENMPVINQMRNPVQATSESLNRGKALWGIYCYPCHGVEGRADGPVAPMFVRPPDFAAPHAFVMTDGSTYAIIKHGRGIMPPYGDKVRGIDRWHLVNYVMALHNAVAPAHTH